MGDLSLRSGTIPRLSIPRHFRFRRGIKHYSVVRCNLAAIRTVGAPTESGGLLELGKYPIEYLRRVLVYTDNHFRRY